MHKPYFSTQLATQMSTSPCISDEARAPFSDDRTILLWKESEGYVKLRKGEEQGRCENLGILCGRPARMVVRRRLWVTERGSF